ncbi:hypothetical protein VNO78_16892 [Psophocarpus tetragonolobus]|uniref:Uncharacterized protein n=1 Tax=Psophocarpus tetragonolobus TaxID=3891 RepID=A0AAN9SLZ8_PSOTE
MATTACVQSLLVHMDSNTALVLMQWFGVEDLNSSNLWYKIQEQELERVMVQWGMVNLVKHSLKIEILNGCKNNFPNSHGGRQNVLDKKREEFGFHLFSYTCTGYWVVIK